MSGALYGASLMLGAFYGVVTFGVATVFATSVAIACAIFARE